MRFELGLNLFKNLFLLLFVFRCLTLFEELLDLLMILFQKL
jgi:hypothetical protein